MRQTFNNMSNGALGAIEEADLARFAQLKSEQQFKKVWRLSLKFLLKAGF